MPDWISFFDSDHPIYVNARHRQVHAALVAQGIGQYIARPDVRAIDYGCGEAWHAERIAAQTGKLILCEAAPQLRRTLAQRFAGSDRIAVMEPAAVAALPAASIDLIVLNSVAQYLTRAETEMLFGLFRRLLRSDGVLVVGDVVRPEVSAIADATALLRLAAGNGFFLAALSGLLRTLLSGYWRLRQAAGLTRYSEAQMTAMLERAGFSVRRAPRNIGHNRARMTFAAQPATDR